LRILHFSDVHVDVPPSAIPLRDWLGKRIVGGLNHALRRRKYFVRSREKLAALARFAENERVDLALGTGDFTILGTQPEIRAASDAVRPLASRPSGLTVLPGNHDLYLGDGVRDDRFGRAFDAWMGTDCPDLGADDGWPRVRLFEGVALVSIASARPNPEPWRSSGRVPDAQLAGLRRVLVDSRLRGRFVIVATHYAPRKESGQPDSLLHGLENADALLDALRGVERGCLVHGHIHKRYRLDLPGVRPSILCAGSTTQEGREGLWMIDVEAGASATATPGRWDEPTGGYVLDTHLARPL
jgi:3',5'-cyclic AMP phosphodiesterase CpdA